MLLQRLATGAIGVNQARYRRGPTRGSEALYAHAQYNTQYVAPWYIFYPRRACARVTVVVLCVCVYPSVPALAASASVETSKQRYSRVSLRLFLDSW